MRPALEGSDAVKIDDSDGGGGCLQSPGGFVGELTWQEKRAVVHGWSIVSPFLHGLHCFYLDSYCCYFLWLMSHLSAPPSPSYSLYLNQCCLLHRPQAGDDLWFLADGLAGELLQYCHAHQAGGSGQGKSATVCFPPPKTPWGWMDGWEPGICGAFRGAALCGKEWALLLGQEFSSFFFGVSASRSDLWCM